MKWIILGAVVACALVVVSGDAWADSIQNWSFENPDIGNPPVGVGYRLITPTGWTWNGKGVGIGVRGVVHETWAGVPATTHGHQWAFIKAEAALSQRIGAGTLQPNTTYSFSFYQFEQVGIDHGSGVQIEIWDVDPFGGTGSPLDSAAFAATGTGVAMQRFATLNSGPSATTGGDLYIVLRAVYDLGNPSNYENVILDEIVLLGAGQPIPEPTTLALLGLGMAGLGWHRRRRRAKAA